jgi:DNA-binding transcriptional LysR family regulator
VQRPRVAIDDAIAVVQAAEQGRGVALVRVRLAEAALSEGRLIAVGEPIAYRWSYYWVAARTPAQDPRHELVFGWLKAQAARR